jgi:hypothetical protein
METGWGGTDITPGYSPSVECLKQHWEDPIGSGGMYENVTNAFRRNMETAETCPDYVLAESIVRGLAKRK